MTWLNSLKIAIVNKNTQKALYLIENLPNFDNIDDLICARELVAQLAKELENEKNTLKEAMQKIKQTKRFLGE
ncbi:MAG: hypothetical protein K2P17_01325 [Helicobacteraceae bacterium]|nr:hypothetical protein [Helicobacteraceae bacterium]